MSEPRYINVAAGILVDERGCVLLTERLGDSPFAGLWEFPGGKINAGESAVAAMARELTEELGIVVRASRHFMNAQHAYADRCVALQFFIVTDWDGEPAGLDGQSLAWRHPREIKSQELLPADAPVLHELRRQALDAQPVSPA